MTKPLTIAIDGFSSSGKSTMAKRLAQAVGYRYVDSGAMYRAVALYALQNKLFQASGSPDTEAVVSALPLIDIEFKLIGGKQHTFLNCVDVESLIRTIEVSNAVSSIAAIPQVRHKLVLLQQQMGQEGGIVMDGRDIGTTVFPNAELKIFVNASAETRAQRRFDELTAKSQAVSYDEVLNNIRQRDHIDMTRAESPLRRADDAIDLDNSSMTLQQQDEWLLNQFNKAVDAHR